MIAAEALGRRSFPASAGSGWTGRTTQGDRDFASSLDAEVLARFAEVESGRKADRPELAKDLHLAKVRGATLVIAKPDRLSRNAAFAIATDLTARGIQTRREGAWRGRSHRQSPLLME